MDIMMTIRDLLLLKFHLSWKNLVFMANQCPGLQTSQTNMNFCFTLSRRPKCACM